MQLKPSQRLSPSRFGRAYDEKRQHASSSDIVPTGALLTAAPRQSVQGTGDTGLQLMELAKWMAPAALVSFFCATGVVTEPRAPAVKNRTAVPLATIRSDDEESIRIETAGEKCVAIKAAFGLTLTELSEVLHASRATLYSWLDGGAKPQDANLERLDELRRLAIYWDAFLGTPLRRSDALREQLVHALKAETIARPDVYAVAAQVRQRPKARLPSDSRARRAASTQATNVLSAIDDYVL
jgi:hypothetical protein